MYILYLRYFIYNLKMKVHHAHSFICLMYPSLRVSTLSFTANILAQDARAKVSAALLLACFCFGGIIHSSLVISRSWLLFDP